MDSDLALETGICILPFLPSGYGSFRYKNKMMSTVIPCEGWLRGRFASQKHNIQVYVAQNCFETCHPV